MKKGDDMTWLTQITMGSLFDGIGGFPLAAVRSGITPIWASEIEAYAQDAAIHHGKVWHGFKLVESRTNRKYTDEEAVIRAANAAGYHDIFKKSLIPITEMEKLMGKKAFAEVLGSLVEKPKGRPTLVPVSDKRPAITTMDATQEFTEITEV